MCQQLRVFHSRRNWLQDGTIYRIQRPYSSTATCWACLMPVTCLVLLVLWGVYMFTDINPTREDSDHYMELRDAKPHWRLSDEQYDHFYENIQFQISRSPDTVPYIPLTNFSATVYQSYDPRSDEREWDCTHYLDENPVTAELNEENGWTDNSTTLCYYERSARFSESNGLYLCRNDGNGEYGDLMVNIGSPRWQYVDSNTYGYLGEYTEVLEQPLRVNQSVTVTLQLWVHRDWGEDGSSDKWSSTTRWEWNSFEIKSIEYDDRSFQPDQLMINSTCYGIKVLMDRIVAVDIDGAAAYAYTLEAFALFGGAYSFVVLFHTAMAIISGFVMRMCCQTLWNRDQEFNTKFQRLQDADFVNHGNNENDGQNVEMHASDGMQQVVTTTQS